LQPLPPSIKQLGLIDTLHYVGYGMTDVGGSLANLQVFLALPTRVRGACDWYMVDGQQASFLLDY
jgi:hypothetical protein